MHLTYPHNGPKLNVDSAPNPATVNFDKLRTATKKENVSTDVAMKAFEEYTQARLDWCHPIKKFAVPIGVYGLFTGAAVGGVGYGAYALLKGPYDAFCENPMSPFMMLYNNEQLLLGGNVITDAIVPYATPRAIMGTFGTIAAFDIAFEKASGIAPVRSFLKLAGLALISFGYKIATEAQKCTKNIYTQTEIEKAKTRESSHHTIFKQTLETYDNIADGLIEECNRGINSPKIMKSLKAQVEELQQHYPVLENYLAKLTLTKSEIAQIMDKLKHAVNNVKINSFGLRNPSSEINNRYNAELLSVLTDEEFKSMAVPQEVKAHGAAVKANTLGIAHLANGLVSTVTKGAVASATTLATTAAAVTGAIYSEKFSLNSDCYALQPLVKNAFDTCMNEAAIVSGTAIIALAIGSIASKWTYNALVLERANAERIKNEHLHKAYSLLKGIYDSVADHLITQKTAVENDPKTAGKLKQDVERIAGKMNAIREQIKKTQLFQSTDVESITKKLEDVIASYSEILKTA